MMVTPSGVQYDAVLDDATGNEDASPDFFWDSATRITERGWTLEIRVPFSSLRYRNMNPQVWRITLFRSYPRDYRYQIASTRVPRATDRELSDDHQLEKSSRQFFAMLSYAFSSSYAAPGS